MSVRIGPYRVTIEEFGNSFRAGLDVGFCINLIAARSTDTPKSGELLDLCASLGLQGRKAAESFCELRPRPLAEYAFPEGERRWTFEARMRAEVAEWLTAQAEPSGDLLLAVFLWPRTQVGGGSNPEALPLKIYASQWQEALSTMQLSHRVSLSLEIPIPAATSPDRFSKVAAALERAQNELRVGRNPRKIMTAVRQSLEALHDALEDKDKVTKATFDVNNKPVQERLQLVRRALWTLCGPAPHAGNPEDTTPYELPEAKAALAMAVAVITASTARRA